MAKVFFHYLDRGTPFIKNKTALKQFIDTIFCREQKKVFRIDYIFCSDEYLLKINRKFLNHNYYTDIITFDLSADKQKITAEIYISTDRIKENAQINHVIVYQEMYRVLIHGALHLCGYKDKTAEEIMVMRDKEDFYLNLYNLFHVKKPKN